MHGGTQANKPTPSHNKAMAEAFLAGLDPRAEKFTFQFVRGLRARTVQIPFAKAWRFVEKVNTPASGFDVFVRLNGSTIAANDDEQIVKLDPFIGWSWMRLPGTLVLKNSVKPRLMKPPENLATAPAPQPVTTPEPPPEPNGGFFATPDLATPELTLFANARGPLTKQYTLDANGNLMKTEGGQMAAGTARRIAIGDVQALAKLIGTISSDQALALGSMRVGLPAQVTVTTKK